MANNQSYFTQDLASAFPASIRPIYEKNLKKTEASITNLRTKKAAHAMRLLELPYMSDDLAAMQQVADKIRQQFGTLIVLGIGGSGLNGFTLAGLLPFFSRKPNVHFLDNIDPYTFTQFLSTCDYEKTAFLCISKSGNTVETLSQLLICIDAFKDKISEKKLAEHFFFITGKEPNPLRAIAETLGSQILVHEDVGGRFSALSSVGLLPAMVLGLNAAAFRKGAASVIDDLLHHTDCEAAKGAAFAMAMIESGHPTTVMMPYIDRLAGFSSWYRQIWAESLGKDGKGSTPIRALGTVDQHSQVQLYLDGPQDKCFTFIALHQSFPKLLIKTNDPALDYINGKTMGELILAEQQATAMTLAKNGSPVRSFILTELNETVMGALLMHFMLETAITADLLGVNAFDQPAVEAGKILTKQLLSEKEPVC